MLKVGNEIVGQKVNSFLILKIDKYTCTVQCCCNKILEYPKRKIFGSQPIKSCGCSRKLNRDLTNERFGKLLVIEWDRQISPRKWKCVCDCGKITYSGPVIGPPT